MLSEPRKHQLAIDDLASPPRKKKFRAKTTPFNLNSTDTEFSKRKNYLIICQLDSPVSDEVVESFSGREFGVDFDVVIDKPSKQEFLLISKKKNCTVNVAKQTVKHFDEQVKTRKEIQSTLTEDINNTSNNSVQQNNEECRKGTTPILEVQQYLGLQNVQKHENQSQIFSRSKN